MAEERGSKFKKFFSGFGGRAEKKPSEQDVPERDVSAPAASAHPVSPDAPAHSAPAEDSFLFPVPTPSPLVDVWHKCGGEGEMRLALFPHSQPKIPISPEAAQSLFQELIPPLEAIAKQWLAQEGSAAAARAAEEAKAAAEAKAATEAKAAEEAARQPESGGEGAGDPPADEPADSPAGEAAEGAEDAPETVPVPLDVSEQAAVLVSKDQLIAWAFLIPRSGNGNCLDRQAGGRMLEEAHVQTGVDEAALDGFWEKKPYFTLTPVAWGVPPTEGENGSVLDHFSRHSKREPSYDEHAVIDYRALNNMQLIHKDDVICDILPPVPGTPGVKLNGDPFPPQEVKPAAVPRGTSTVLSEDGAKLLAEVDGMLEFSNDVFNIKNLLDIKSGVDYSTGNIDFIGDVCIHGDVREQFSVKATGNVTIDGLVEAASVEAGGDLVISKGVSGNAQAVLRGKLVRARYLESCTVHASERVETDYIMSSKIYSDGSVAVVGSHGSIINSLVVAGTTINATKIGSQSGQACEITLGVIPKVRDELYSNRESLITCRKEADEIEKRIIYIQKRFSDPSNPASAAKLAECQPLAKRLNELRTQEKELLDRQSELIAILSNLPACRLECSTVHAGVKLAIGSASMTFDRDKDHCIATFDSESKEIKFA